MDRRRLLGTAAEMAVGASLVGAALANAAEARTAGSQRANAMNIVEARDGTQLFYGSWGTGRPIIFVAAWALNSEAWQYQMVRMSDEGFRCIAFDRRSHGRSSDPGSGYDLDTLADDLAAVLTQLDIRDAILVGHSLGAAEAVRYLTLQGTARISRLVLIAPTT